MKDYGSFLDEVKYRSGSNALSEAFRNIAKEDHQKALAHINHQSLEFGTLYSLRNDLEELGLLYGLNPRNKAALEFVKAIENKKSRDGEVTASSCKTATPETLEWLIDKGFKHEDQDPTYFKVMDTAAVFLTKLHNRKNHAVKVRDLLFSRYRKDIFSHDLTWAFFELRVPASLYQIAEGLLSQHRRDFELTCKLLWFIPGIQSLKAPNRLALYYSCTHWIYENLPFMYYTGENFQQSCKPIPYAISLDAKYLCKNVDANTGTMKSNLSEEENQILREYQNLDTASRQSLADYSFALYRLNPYLWTIWLRYPLAEQLKMVKMAGGAV